jgi:hypothetical protein
MFLKLHYNQLNGTLLPEIGDLESLVELKLGNNNFEGELPVSWSTLWELNTLWVENNPGITGGVPSAYGSLESLGTSKHHVDFSAQIVKEPHD